MAEDGSLHVHCLEKIVMLAPIRHFSTVPSPNNVFIYIVCDGHPQCQQGEDEDLDLCHEIYVKKKIVSKFATHRCKAATYSGNAH